MLKITSKSVKIFTLLSILLLIIMPILTSLIVNAIIWSEKFEWDKSEVHIGEGSSGKGEETLRPDIFLVSTVHLVVATNYTINGVMMPQFKITGQYGGIPTNVPILHKYIPSLHAEMWYAEYQGIKIVGIFPTDTHTVGWYIYQSIPADSRLSGQWEYGVAGGLNTPTTNFWYTDIPSDEYSYQELYII